MATVLLSISVCTVCVCVCVSVMSALSCFIRLREGSKVGAEGAWCTVLSVGLEGNKSKLKRHNLYIKLETGKEQIQKQMQPNTKATQTHTHTNTHEATQPPTALCYALPVFWPSGPAACLPASMQAHRCQCVSPVHAKKLFFCQK